VTPERWRQVNDLFHAAAGLDTAGRRRLLLDAGRTDPELAAEVQSLLTAHDSGGQLLDQPVWAVDPHLILDEDDALQPGTVAGPYRIVREIGRGGMGVVYEAEDTRLRRSVALKALPSQYTRDPHRRERLTREARAAAALAHPAIATVYALDELEGALYLVTELVRGDTLREELRAGAVRPELLVPTLIELASGLAAAHAAGIVHRDFKPENIVRCADGRVKILDFGLARMPGGDPVTQLRLTQTGMAMGTPGYMAPEQLSGQDAEASTDVFAFGIVAWELATGAHPFGATPAELLARMTDLMDGRPVTAVGAALPIAGLERILRKCLRRNPGDRYPEAGPLLLEVERLSASGGWPAGPPAGDQAPLWWWQMHQAMMAVVVAGMPVACWFLRAWDRSAGSRIFLVVLALSTVAVTIRLNLLFTSRVHPGHLSSQRRRVYLPMAVVEATLGAILLASGVLAAASHDGLAAVLVTLAVATVASLGIIEPATTRAAGLAGGENLERSG
jgi:hypothetical protein